MSSNLKTKLNAFFSELKSTYTPTNTINQYVYGFSNLATKAGTTAMFVVDKGMIDVVSTSASIVPVDCVLFIQVLRQVNLQDILLEHLEDIYGFFKLNQRLGGVQSVEIGNWDMSVSDDGTSVGLLTVELTVSVII